MNLVKQHLILMKKSRDLAATLRPVGLCYGVHDKLPYLFGPSGIHPSGKAVHDATGMIHEVTEDVFTLNWTVRCTASELADMLEAQA